MQYPAAEEKKPEQRDETAFGSDPPPKPVEAESGRRPRGFAAMDRNLVKDIARKGGKAAHAAGTAHEFTSDEAREAGRKGGQATHARRRERVDKHPSSEK
jgi:general stress protein YciG